MRTNCGDFPTTIGTKHCNALPPKLKSLNSLGSFKGELYELHYPDSLNHKFHEKLFRHGNRSMNIFYACLRMCSKLNAHLKNNLHVIDHESIRNLISTVQAVINVEVSTELLLFSNNNLSTDQNLIIVDAVHLFLNKCRQLLND